MPTYTNLVCQNCYKEFKRHSRHIASARIQNCKSIFCSLDCKNKHSIQTIEVFCKQCNTKFPKLPSQIKKSPNNFCSRSCSTTYNNTHKTQGNRRSKLEIFLEEQIRNIYPTLILRCNDKTKINSELDFYFPELQLAIELNGIFHYEPVFGQSKLAQMQKNDNRKSFLCQKHQINLAIVDSSSCKYLNETAKNKYWKIVEEIIQSALLC